MIRNIAVVRETHAVATHLHDDVLTEDDDLLCAVLQPNRVRHKHSGRYPSAELLHQRLRNGRSETRAFRPIQRMKVSSSQDFIGRHLFTIDDVKERQSVSRAQMTLNES